MKIRTLLLESTAALTVIGAAQAQAADKVVKPAPVNYVQVCDAYGIGYFIIPGQKDVCLRIQGQIQFQVNFHTRDTEFYGVSTTSWHDAGWDSQAIGQVTFTAKRQTDHGPLTGVIRFTGTSANAQNIQVGTGATVGRVPVDRYAQIDRVWMQLGNFKAGYDSSVYGVGTTKQVALNWTVGGYGIAVAVDDPRDRWGTRLPRYYNVPDIVANITAAPKWGTWGLAVGYARVDSSATDQKQVVGGIGTTIDVWGVSAKTTINTPALGKGDQLSLSATVGTGCAFVSNNCGQGTINTGATMWQALAQFKHVFNAAWNTTWQYQWTDPNPAAEQWQAQAALVWQGISNFQVQTYVRANQTVTRTAQPVFSGQVQLQWAY